MPPKQPHLLRLPGPGNAHHLIVDGRPFFMRAAELNNSSLSSVEWMNTVWPRMVANNINTVLGSIGWEQVESQEGAFDFGVLDLIIAGARSYGLKLVLLWFGAFKNGVSTYAPDWVKKDSKRFPRALISDPASGDQKVISHSMTVFDRALLEADTKAFCRLLEHLKTVDAQHNTVVMIQVENETGLLGDSRDRCPQADTLFKTDVPPAFIQKLAKNRDNLLAAFKRNLPPQHQLENARGSWEMVFGSSLATDEIFMAYHTASWVEHITKAGKQVYPLPMYTNGWLRYAPSSEEAKKDGFPQSFVSGGARPGVYPSGSPNDTTLDIWHLFAPALDFIAPDIYTGNYEQWCRIFSARNQPLFIPEQRHDLHGAIRIWAAIGSYNAIGTSPFGIDSQEPSTSPFTAMYGLLAQVEPLIISARNDCRSMCGFFFDPYIPGETDPEPPHKVFELGGYRLRIERSSVMGHPGPAFGLIIHAANDTFTLIGEGYQVFTSDAAKPDRYVGISHFDEKIVDDGGRFVTGRKLNGDETCGGTKAIMPGAKPDYGGFFIAVWIPANTRIAELQVYKLEA